MSRRKLTTEEFVARARKIHGDKYEYNLVNYIGINTKIKIICPIHNVFEQTPEWHLKGTGCPRCAKACNTEDFILKARSIHGDEYDYSKTEFISSLHKTEIICKKHGVFLQTPNKHLLGRKCPVCVIDKNSPVRYKFLNTARKKFDNKFEYVIDTYKSMVRSMRMICPVHGEINMTPKAHLNSADGCTMCASDKESAKGRKCDKCGELKPLTEYYKHPDIPGGRNTTCKKCVLKVVTKNKNNKCKYNVKSEELPPCDRPTNIDGMLWVACKKCGKMFQPKVWEVTARVMATVKVGKGDGNFYCSSVCKGSCSIFYKKGSMNYSKALMSRKCQKPVKDVLLELQCDEVGYQYCERCGDIISTDMHHVIEVAKHGTEKAYEPASMMLLCPNCHRITHNQCK